VDFYSEGGEVAFCSDWALEAVLELLVMMMMMMAGNESWSKSTREVADTVPTAKLEAIFLLVSYLTKRHFMQPRVDDTRRREVLQD
jgi:hypothetical protein